jgi:hypothetical protein
MAQISEAQLNSAREIRAKQQQIQMESVGYQWDAIKAKAEGYKLTLASIALPVLGALNKNSAAKTWLAPTALALDGL